MRTVMPVVPTRAAVDLIQGPLKRANQTLQDRLIKEMRLPGVSDIAGAQASNFGTPGAPSRRWTSPTHIGHG